MAVCFCLVSNTWRYFDIFQFSFFLSLFISENDMRSDFRFVISERRDFKKRNGYTSLFDRIQLLIRGDYCSCTFPYSRTFLANSSDFLGNKVSPAKRETEPDPFFGPIRVGLALFRFQKDASISAHFSFSAQKLFSWLHPEAPLAIQLRV